MANRFKVVKGGPYPHFVTLTVVRWYPVFVSGPFFKILIDALNYMRCNRGLQIHAYVVMPTHIHLIVTAIHDNLSDIVRDYKRYTAREILHQAKEDGNKLLSWIFANSSRDANAKAKVWQDEFHPEVIYTREFFLQKADYMHRNPIRKGLAADATSYYYSSAAAFDRGEMGPLEVDWLDW